jgi:hypothetical protein
VVSTDIRFEFLGPELYSRLWHVGESAAWMSMPEAAMNEDDLSAAWEH